ncbi:hypothetical protein ESA94_04010 [Lacibacter luteus]|uniref:Lipocalin-like domain-containing protein n=1 Tax=Lacibacter luteus TaxID=2508719 RepID=A0A4Q1CME0_9BACT|nr:hypothetical protein [Lacibacter luteus]RXK62186.1 hypothetical protein ESA94_04010 [Lacibacter luteus]
MRVFISIIVSFVCTTSCNQEISIVGHWRPVDAFVQEQNGNSNVARFRDLILNNDSTFILVGLDQQPKQSEGWNNTGTLKGKWSLTNGILSLLIDEVPLPVKFKVIKLTNREMVIENEHMKSVESKLMRVKK